MAGGAHLSTDQFNLQLFGGFDDGGEPFVVAWGSCRSDSAVSVTITQTSDGSTLVAEPDLDDGVWIADMDREVSELTINVDGAETTQPLARLFEGR